MLDFAMLPPEINSGRMYSGPGSSSLLAAASTWDGVAAEMRAAFAGCRRVLDDLGATGWSGPSAAAMTAAARPYLTWLSVTAAAAEHTAIQVRAAVAAYEAAFSMTVPPPVIAANRAALATLIATNFLGQNTPAIAATEAAYATMWAQDATAMFGYAAGAAAATRITPFTEPPRATVHAATPATGLHASSALPGVPAALHSVTTPGAAPAAALSPALALEAAIIATEIAVDLFGTFGVDVVGTFVIDTVPVSYHHHIIRGPSLEDVLPHLSHMGGNPVLAHAGRGAPIGRLTAPPSWTQTIEAAATVTLRHAAAPAAGAGPGLSRSPAVSAASIGAAGLAGAVSTAGGSGADRPPVHARRVAKPIRKAAKGSIVAIAPALRELAEQRDAGFLTEERFAEHKRRLLNHQKAGGM